jgi:hypothetical protein
LKTTALDISNESTVHGEMFSNKQNHSCINFWCCVTENTPSPRDIGIFEVNCSHYGQIEMVKTVTTDANGCVGDCGIENHPPADC